MSQTDNNLQRKIQGTQLSDLGDSSGWQYLKWGSLAVLALFLLIIPHFAPAVRIHTPRSP